MQVVLARAWNKDTIGTAVDQQMVDFANRGFRSLGLAISEDDVTKPISEVKWSMVALLPLFDPPRHDTKDTIERCLVQGIEVKVRIR